MTGALVDFMQVLKILNLEVLTSELDLVSDQASQQRREYQGVHVDARPIQGQNLDDFPNVKRWFEQIAARPAVAKDMAMLEDVVGEFDEESWEASFGAEQYKRR